MWYREEEVGGCFENVGRVDQARLTVVVGGGWARKWVEVGPRWVEVGPRWVV